MTDTILCATEIEPGGFHPADTLAVSARLAFETDDQANAEQLHKGFLESLAARRFVAVDVLAPGAPVLVEAQATPNVFDRSLTIDRFLPWLAGRAGPGLHELTGSGGQQIDVGAEDTHSMPAGPLVLSAAGWTAPLPGKLGLSSIAPFAAKDLPLPADDPKKAYVVVPIFGGGPLWDLGIDPGTVRVEGKGKDRVASFTYRARQGEEPRGCRTNVLSAPTPDATSLVDPATGFLLNHNSARHLYRIIGAVERKGGSLLATLPAALRIRLDLPEPPSADGARREQDQARLGFLAWHAMACLLGALDPIVIALTMPHPETARPRLGPLLSPFANALRKHLSEANVQPTQDQIGAALRAGLATLRVVPGGTGQDRAAVGPFPQTIAERARLVRDLGSLLLPQDARTVTLNVPEAVGAATDLWAAADALRKQETTALLPWLQAVYVLDGFSIPDPSTKPGEPIKTIEIITLLADALRAAPGALPLDPDKPHTLDALAAASGLSLDARLARELAPLVDAATAESAVEGTIARLLTAASIGNPDPTKDPFVEETCADLGLAGRPEVPAAVIAARQGFLDLLAGPFNGAEAVRQACSAVFLDHLMAGWQPVPDDDAGERTAEAARDRLVGTRYFAERFQAVAPPANPAPANLFARILARLIRPSEEAYRWPEVATGLDEALGTAAAELLPAGDGRRFTPSHKPDDIPLQITLDDSTEDGDEFEKRFAGVGLLVRREDGDTGEAGDWSHANLANVTVQAEKPTDKIRLGDSVAPLRSVLVDGRRQLFLTYAGLPFTAAAFADATPVEDASEARKPFFTVDFPNETNTVPTLAYKSLIEIAGFVVTVGGSVPELIRSGAPWEVKATLPAGSLPEPGDAAAAQGWTFKHAYQYERTTAIGMTAIREGGSAVSSRTAGRFGVVPEGVRPLSKDYPRLSLTAQTSLDLFRRPDGTGDLVPVSSEPLRIVLRNFGREGGGLLTVEVHSRPDIPFDWTPASGSGARVDAPPLLEQAVALVVQVAVANGHLTLAVAFVDGAGRAVGEVRKSASVALPALGEDPSRLPGLWLRLRLDEATATSVSFAVPTASPAGGSRPGGDSLLLLAPKAEAKTWVEALQKDVKASVQRPWVGHLDLERWLANRELARRVMRCPGVEEADDILDKRTREFRETLYGASILRTLAPDRAERLDRLIDPAVSHLAVELSRVDDLDDGRSPTPTPQRRIVPLPSLGGLIVRAQKRLPVDDGRQDPDDLLRLIEEAALSLTIRSEGSRLRLEPDQNQIESAIEVIVPPGMAARLTVRPLVEESLVGNGATLAAIDGRMRQLALGRTHVETVPHLIFDGATLLIEAMIDGLKASDDWPSIVGRALRVVPEAGARAYALELETDPDDRRAWRMVSSVAIDTQCWRFTGRPIYHWIQPSDGRSPNAAVRLTAASRSDPGKGEVVSEDLARFEVEAFAGRPALDAEPSTAQVAPLPARSRIARVEWKGTATLFRHRIAVRSRYAAALTRAETRTRDAWSPLNQDDQLKKPEDWVRVAMLAERPRVPLTRPQVRALMPLTTDPGADGASPPALAIVQEAPFGAGGLAERIAAEVALSVGYAMKGQNSQKRLHPVDTRQQEGPDPRLSYAPADRENALALASEGPVGLTFEPGVPAPAFPNMALILKPIELDEDAMPQPSREAERFVGAALRRYFDPHWVVAASQDTGRSVRLNESWWLEFGTDERDILKVDDVICCRLGPGTPLRIQVERRIVDPTLTPADLKPAPAAEGGTSGQDEARYLTIATLPKREGVRLALLHVPLEPGRWSMSVLLLPRQCASGEAAGRGDQALVLASLDWSLPEGTAGLDPPEVAGPILRIAASPVTDLTWVRTSRDFEVVHVVVGLKAQSIPARDLVALWDGAAKALTFARATDRVTPVLPVASLSAAPQPLHVQRHLGLLYTDVIADFGLPALEQPRVPARRLIDAGQALLGAQDKRPDQVRIIEFETPAAVFGVMDGMQQIPAPLRAAYFDLRAVGYRPGAEGDAGFLLAIRLTASSADLRRIREITLAFRAVTDGDNAEVQVKVGFDRGTGQEELRWLHLALEADTGKVTGFAVDALGRPIKVRAIEAALPQIVKANPGFTLKAMPLSDGLTECWFDASLLTAKSGAPLDAIDFDWFLRSEPAEPGSATTPEALSTMTEAQSRIISVSPPIQIFEKGQEEAEP